MTSTANARRPGRLRNRLTGAALATGGAVMLAGGAQAQAGDKGVPDGFSAATDLPNVSGVRTLADGSVEVTLTDGRVLIFQADEVELVDGEVYIAEAAVNAADFSVSAAAGGGGGGAGAALGVLGGGALLGAAAGGGGGGGSSPAPDPTPDPSPNNAPSFTSGASASTVENAGGTVYTATATDPDGDSLTFSISGGADAGLFSINASTGALSFNTAPDFENPADADGDNAYEVTLRVSDGSATAEQTVTITVTNEDEAPEFSSSGTASVVENSTGVAYSARAEDPEGEAVTYSLGGADAALFAIDAVTGDVSFLSPPDHENPQDADGNNVYEITVTASDGSLTSSQAVAITVTNESEAGAPTFVSASSSTVSEAQTSAYVIGAEDAGGDVLSYSISGTDAALFSVDSATGEVRFNAVPDFEAPGDADGDNVYEITVTASDGSNSAQQDVSITVTDAAEGSDLPDDNTTDIRMVSGGSYVGELETAGDKDWIRVELTAGQRYQFDLTGTGAEPVEDTFIRLYDASGALIGENDDIDPGVIRDSRLTFTATESGTYYIEVDSWDGGSADERTGEYTLEISHTDPLRNWTYQEIGDYLRSGFGGAQFNASTGDTLTVNITALTAAGQFLARAALDLWSDITGLVFTEVTGSAQITFDDDEEGAFAGPDGVSGGFITAASVNVGTEWLDTYGTTLDTYSFQTYIHEIGHALGLGHAGPYNVSATYGVDNIYLNDSWQASVMSYFSQNENTQIDASVAFVVGLQVADIIAARDMYGLSTTTRAGDTVYGFNSNAGTIYNANNGFSNATTFTVYDAGGIDTFDYSGSSSNQTLDLREEQFSSVLGLRGNVGIATGTVIENAIGGSGNDTLIGNDADNVLTGNGGNDRFFASGGSDTFIGGVGIDTAVFSGAATDYTVSTNGSGNTVITDNRAGSPDGTVELIGTETIEYGGKDSYPDFFQSGGKAPVQSALDFASLPVPGVDLPVMKAIADYAADDFALSPVADNKLPVQAGFEPSAWDRPATLSAMDGLSDPEHTDLNAGTDKHDHHHVFPHLDPADWAEIRAWGEGKSDGAQSGFDLLAEVLGEIDVSGIARSLADGGDSKVSGRAVVAPADGGSGSGAAPDAGLPLFAALSDDRPAAVSDDVWL